MRIVNFMSDTAVCSLAYGEHLTLWAFRTIAVGHGGCRAVARAFEDALDADARAAQRALAIFAYELGCATSARRLKLAPPGASNLTRDEASLLSLFGAAQSRGATEVRDRLAKLGVDAPGETLLAALFVYSELTRAHGLALPGDENSLEREDIWISPSRGSEPRRFLH